MSEDLKTLKDIREKAIKDICKNIKVEPDTLCNFGSLGMMSVEVLVTTFLRDDLKQEAIKEIKFLQTLPESLKDCYLIEENNPELFEKYFALFDAMAAYDNSNVIDYIKWKFNVEEEELK